MCIVREKVYVRAPVEKAWESVLDFESRPKYMPRVLGVTYPDGKPLKVGSRIKLTIARDQFTPVVEAIDPPYRLALQVKGLGFHTRHVCEVAASDNGAFVALSATYAGPLGTVLGRLTKK